MFRLLNFIFIILLSSNILASNSNVNVEKTPDATDNTVISKSNFPDFSLLAKDLLPTVVNISTTKKVSDKSYKDIEELIKTLPNNSVFGDLRDLLEKQKSLQKEIYSAGSGFIVSADGYIVTNNHVVDDADKITISLHDGKKIQAQLIGSDPKTDLALLKIKTDKKLKFTKFGDSDKSEIGQWVIAVGNPFGLGGSVSAGIISARGRDISSGQINDFIQTDAAINKGNSGGPLFNIDGEVVGIATAIYSPSGGNIGIGFATPSNIANQVIEKLKTDGEVKRGYLGVSVQDISKEIAESIAMKNPHGAMVVKVFDDTPAAKSKILPGDIITIFDGQKIKKMKDLPMVVARTEIGKKVKIIVIRNGKEKTLKAKIDLLKSEKEKKKEDKKSEINILGMGLQDINNKIRDKYDLNRNIDGVLITNIDKNSQAAKKGIAVNDVLLSVNQMKLKSVSHLKEIIKKARENKRDGIFIIIKRGNNNFATVLSLK